MITQDSVDPFWAANLDGDVPDLDVDVSGAGMDAPDASCLGRVDADGGVLHGNIQVPLNILACNDAGRRPFVEIDVNVADNDMMVAAEVVVGVKFVAPIAVDAERGWPIARDRHGASRDFRVHGARLPVVGDRNPPRVRRHVGGREERDVARMARIRLDPDGAVERVFRSGENQLVVVGVVAVVVYREVIAEPDGEIALVRLARAVHDVAVRSRVVVRGRTDDRRPRLGWAALALCPRRAGAAEHDGQDQKGHDDWKYGVYAPRETRTTCIAFIRSDAQNCRFLHQIFLPFTGTFHLELHPTLSTGGRGVSTR